LTPQYRVQSASAICGFQLPGGLAAWEIWHRVV